MGEQMSPETAGDLMQYYKDHPEMRGDNETPLEIRADWTYAGQDLLDGKYTITERPEWRARVNIPQEQTPVTHGTIDHPRRVTNKRGELLTEAERIVNGARNVQYGDPNADFQCTADLWNLYIGRVTARQHEGNTWALPVLAPADVAVMMILLKVSRIGWSPEKADHWLDIAGYAACGYDCSPALLDAPGTAS